MKMSEIRAKYPEYADLPDEQLVIGLHRKFYSDMPFADFHKKIEYEAKKEPFFRPPSPEQAAMIKRMEERPWGSGIPKAANQFGGAVTDVAAKVLPPELAAGAGYLANVGTQAIPALASSYRFAGEPLQSMANAPARGLMQSAMKPSQADLKTGDAGRAIGTMLQEGISPTGGGMSKAAKLAEKLNESTAGAVGVSTAQADIPAVMARLDPLRARAAMQVNPEADMAAIEKVASEFQGSPAISNASSIPVQLAQKLKSGTYSALGNKAYGELGSSSVEAQKQLARGLREEVISKVPEIAEPLKREASLRNVMEVSANRALQDANKNPLSLGTSIAAIMHDPLAAAGMWANASTPIKAMMARMLFTGGRPEVALPAAIAGSEALNQPRDQ